MSAEILQFLCFRLANRVFALDIMGVSEILRDQSLTQIPNAPEVVIGVANVRGDLITVLDLHRVLDIEEKITTAGQKRIIIGKLGGERFGMMVDEVMDVHTLKVEDIIPVPATHGARLGSILGMFRRHDQNVEVVVMLIRLGAMGALARGETIDEAV